MGIRPTLAVAAMTAPALLFAQAQAPKPFTPGDVFIDQNGDTLQVTTCRGTDRQAECQLRRLAASGSAPIDPSGRWWMVDTLRASERNWIANGGHRYTGPSVSLAGATKAAAPVTASPAAAGALSGAKAGAACPKTPYGGPVPGTRPASAALFRQKIADATTMGAYGPYWYGVRFDAFQVGTPLRNAVGTRPGQGTNRVTNGAPVGATLHPVTTTISICEGAPAGSSAWRTRTSKYLCFVSANNEWTCGATN